MKTTLKSLKLNLLLIFSIISITGCGQKSAKSEEARKQQMVKDAQAVAAYNANPKTKDSIAKAESKKYIPKENDELKKEGIETIGIAHLIKGQSEAYIYKTSDKNTVDNNTGQKFFSSYESDWHRYIHIVREEGEFYYVAYYLPDNQTISQPFHDLLRKGYMHKLNIEKE